MADDHSFGRLVLARDDHRLLLRQGSLTRFFSDAAVLIALRERWPFAEPIDLPEDAFLD